MPLPETVVTNNRQKVARIAQDMIDGQVGIIDGSRQLASLRHRIDMDEMDEDFLPFVGIDSETDSLPLGDDRRHWAADALRRKDAEIAAAEAHWRGYALPACERLVVRFTPNQ
jgi:hypothetical protein